MSNYPLLEVLRISLTKGADLMKGNPFAVYYSGLNYSLAHQGRSFVKRGITVFLILLITMVVLVPPAQAAGSAQAETFHFQVPAAAEIWVSTCPFGDWLPETDTVCEDWQT